MEDWDGIKKITAEEYYYGRQEKLTSDGLWTLEELEEDVDDECHKQCPRWELTMANRAVLNRDLFKENIMSEKIKEFDLIEHYNAELAKYPGIFGINSFDQWIGRTIEHLIKENMVAK